MKSVFMAGSRKFYDEIAAVRELLEREGLNAFLPDKGLGESTFEGEKTALLKAFSLIDGCDLVYVFAKEGYVGKTVALEIAYAFARGKEIVSSESVQDNSVRALVSKTLSPFELTLFLKN